VLVAIPIDEAINRYDIASFNLGVKSPGSHDAIVNYSHNEHRRLEVTSEILDEIDRHEYLHNVSHHYKKKDDYIIKID
jgi:hypothetical protein